MRRVAIACARREADRGRTRAVGTTTPNVVEENFRCQFERTKVADGMTLKKLQMCLLATLPFGNGLERVHVPTYETSQGMGNLLDSRQFRGRFELYFAAADPAAQ